MLVAPVYIVLLKKRHSKAEGENVQSGSTPKISKRVLSLLFVAANC